MYRQILTLATAQALFQTVSVLVVTVGALAGAQIAPRPEWATIPIATMLMGTALLTFPAAHGMKRLGRKRGFVWGAVLGVLGCLTCALAMYWAMLPLLALGTFLVGGYQAFAQFYRFAASEVATPLFRPRAISWVMGGGIVAAFLGPFLGRLGSAWLTPTFIGSFLIGALIALLGVASLLSLHAIDISSTDEHSPAPRHWSAIVKQPAYLLALFAAMTGYGVMVLGMTATPIAMCQSQHDLGATATVIQFHVLGMFLPSFFTGALIARFGVLKVMFAGIALLTGYVFMARSNTDFSTFVIALSLLGVGWNFLYIGATNLLTRTYHAAEKTQAQAINDMTVFAVGLLCSFGAGWMQQQWGWKTLNLMLLPWLATAALAIVGYGLRSRRISLEILG